jgi:hypothetical protein
MSNVEMDWFAGPQEQLRLTEEAKEHFKDTPGIVGYGVGEKTLDVYVESQVVADALPSGFKGARIRPIISGAIVAD